MSQIQSKYCNWHSYHVQLLQLNHDDYENSLSVGATKNYSWLIDRLLFCGEAPFQELVMWTDTIFHYPAQIILILCASTDSVISKRLFWSYGWPHRTLFFSSILFTTKRVIFLKNIPVNTRQQMWSLHDAAPIHNTQRNDHTWISNFPYSG